MLGIFALLGTISYPIYLLRTQAPAVLTLLMRRFIVSGTGQAENSEGIVNVPLSKLSRFDAHLRIVLALIEQKDWHQLTWHTGVVVHDRKLMQTAPPQPLPLVIELQARGDKSALLGDLKRLNVFVPELIATEFARVGSRLRSLPATLALDPFDPSKVADKGRSNTQVLLSQRLSEILAVKSKLVHRIALSAQHLPCLVPGAQPGDILASLGIPPDRTYTSGAGLKKRLTGDGVVIGIIDDGCPFAHPDFLRNVGTRVLPNYKSRVALLWDQNRDPTVEENGRGWNPKPATSGYGREINAAAIEGAINNPVKPNRPHITPQGWIEEETVYQYLGYPMGAARQLASHGGRVAGIAASNGQSFCGREGVAPDAQIVFVQLPKVSIDSNPAALANDITVAMQYIFDYADSKMMPAVVNISYGGYSGAHDGSSQVEAAIDDYLTAKPNRAVVVSAGNGFEADCHTHAKLRPVTSTKPLTRDWIINPQDPSQNELEIWYNSTTTLSVTLQAPDGSLYGPFKPNPMKVVLARPNNGLIIGNVVHDVAGTDDYLVLISLRPTFDVAPPPIGSASAPAGTWKLSLENEGAKTAHVYCWIRRDDAGPLGARRQQSHFHPEQARPDYTICDTASGRLSISVGAFNSATGEVARYSAAGPTRPSQVMRRRRKPDICAPGESLPHGGGVLATSSARGLPTRIGGTSASAPHVAGLVALIFEFAGYVNMKLPAAKIQRALAGSINPALVLVPNQHQQSSRYPKVKQSKVWRDLIGRGATDFTTTMRTLFP